MKKPSLPKPITILILTLLTAILWVGMSIYRTVTVKPPVTVPENISKPLNPSLNTAVIEKIETRIYIPDSDVPQLSTVTTGTVSVTPSPEPLVTPAATSLPVSTSSASPSPQL